MTAAWRVTVAGDQDLRAALVQVGDDIAAAEGLVGDQPAKSDAIDEGRYADCVEALPGQEFKADEIAESP